MTMSVSRACLFVVCAFSVIASPVAQAAKIERETVARSLELRRELLTAWLAADRGARESAASHCATLGRVRPLGTLDDAVTLARGAEIDVTTSFRGDLLPLVAPEVLDPATYPSVFVTIRTTGRGAPGGEIRFVCRLLDRKSKAVQTSTIEPKNPSDELLTYDLRTALPILDQDDGALTVEVELQVDGEPVGAPWRLPIRVSRGFAKRVDALPLYYSPFHSESYARGQKVDAELVAVANSLDTVAEQAAYVGALMRVDRAFRGHPRVRGCDPLRDLEQFERVRANLDAGRDPYAEMTGRTTITIPLTDEVVRDDAKAFLRIPRARVSVDLREDRTARPLVVFLPGTPSWDGGSDRPLAPRAVAPEWLVDRLEVAGFDRESNVHTAVIESVGEMRSPTNALITITRALLERLSVDTERVVWVGEREGAFCVSRALLAAPELVSGAVLVLGGSLAKRDFEQIEAPLLLIGAHGHGSSTVLDGLAKRAAHAGVRATRLEGDATRPWPIALSASASAIEAFVADHTR